VLLARAEGPHGFERNVVLKLLLQQFREDEKFERMFAREAAAYARLSHPAIVKLYDFFSDSSQLVMVLEFIDGLPLHKLRALLRPKGWGLDDRAAMFIGWRVFSALSAAHSARDPQSGEYSPVIHRDVNPSNVLIPWDGHVKIADFGIAKVAGVDGETQAGLIKGTYGYMAPEQVRGEPLTVRADVYAASLLLWELLAGRKAIVRGNSSDIDVLRAMAEPSFPSLASLRPDLPKAVLEAVARGLEPEPDRRAVYADELCSALRTAISLDEGRQALIDVLGQVRPPSAIDDLAVTTSRPPPPPEPSPSEEETQRFRSEAPPPISPDDTLADAPKVPKAPLPARGGLGTTISVAGTPPRPASGAPPRFAASVTLKMNPGGPHPPAAQPAAQVRPASAAQPAPIAPKIVPKTPPAFAFAKTALAPAGGPTPAAPVPSPPVAPAPGTAPQPPTPPQPAALPPPVAPPGPLSPRAPTPVMQTPRTSAPPSPLAATLGSNVTSPLPSDLPQSHVPTVTPAMPPPSPHAAWTPGYPSNTGAPAVMTTGAAAWAAHRGWVVAIAISIVVSLCSIAVLVLWTRKDPRATASPKPSASGLASASPRLPSSAALAPASNPPASAAVVPPPAPVAPPAPNAPPAAIAPPAPAPGLAANMGTVKVPTRGGHRVWIDERLVGESPGNFAVRCGSHMVRVGSAGTAQHLNVPCGGEAEAR
jgi:serine/threonine-protein kinase